MKRIVFLIFFLLVLNYNYSQSIWTNAASNIEQNNATLNATASGLNISTQYIVRFYYNLNPTTFTVFIDSDPITGVTESSDFNTILSELSSSTLYYFSAHLYEYDPGTPPFVPESYEYIGSGAELSFTTLTQTGTITWDGSSSSDWNTASNWDLNYVPESGNDVIIPTSGVTNMPTIYSGTFSINDITVEAGSRLTINSGVTLNVGGNALLKSPSNGTGMPGTIIEYGNLNTTGTAAIERYIADQKWHLFSSPVNNATTSILKDYYFAYYNESGVPFYWTRIKDTRTITAGKGYELNRMDQANLITLSGNEFNSGNITINDLTNSDVSPDSNHDSDYGWNLVGNPYPSSINMASGGLNRTNVDAAVYVLVNGQYLSYTIGTGGNEAARLIAPLQGFFIHVNSATGSVGFTNTLQTTSSVSYKSGQISDNLEIITLSIASEEYSSDCYFAFKENATELFDSEYDAYKLIGFNDSIPETYSFLSDSTMMSINSFPLERLANIDNSGIKYKLGIKKGVYGNLTFSLTNTEKIPERINLFLIDKQEGKQTNLLKENYAFTTGENDDSTRFELLVAPRDILVEQIEIKSETNADSIEVNSTIEFSATVFPDTASNRTVNWSVNDNDGIASIDSKTGLLSALQNTGKVIVTASANDDSGIIAQKEIYVYKNIVLVDSVNIWHNSTGNTFAPNSTIQLFANVSPENATNKTYTWKSSNIEIAEVDSISGMVNTFTDGIVSINAIANDDSGTKGEITLTISTPTVYVDSIKIWHADEDNIIEPNSILKLDATVFPENSTISTLTWFVKPEEIASIDSYGQLTAKKEGDITVYAKSNDGSNIIDSISISIIQQVTYVNSIEITTNKDSLEVNSQMQLSSDVLPENASNGTITWSVTPEDKASIDSYGLLTALKEGDIAVKASSNDGSGVYGEIYLRIYTITSINEDSNILDINIYPNPSRDILNIVTNCNNCSYSIFNSAGQIVLKNSFRSEIKIDISTLESGIYFININSNNKSFSDLLIIQ